MIVLFVGYLKFSLLYESQLGTFKILHCTHKFLFYFPSTENSASAAHKHPLHTADTTALRNGVPNSNSRLCRRTKNPTKWTNLIKKNVNDVASSHVRLCLCASEFVCIDLVLAVDGRRYCSFTSNCDYSGGGGGVAWMCVWLVAMPLSPFLLIIFACIWNVVVFSSYTCIFSWVLCFVCMLCIPHTHCCLVSMGSTELYELVGFFWMRAIGCVCVFIVWFDVWIRKKNLPIRTDT